jgi:hypothetical protein
MINANVLVTAGQENLTTSVLHHTAKRTNRFWYQDMVCAVLFSTHVPTFEKDTLFYLPNHTASHTIRQQILKLNAVRTSDFPDPRFHVLKHVA